MSASAKTSAANAQAMRRRTSPSSTVLPSTCSNRTNPPNAGSRGNGSKPPGINPICSNCLESDMRRPWHNAQLLLRLANILELPVLVTTQYSKGLGPTIPEIASLLPTHRHAIDKLEFGCFANNQFCTA